MVIGTVVLVVVEGAVTLQQTEAAWVFVEVGIYPRVGRIYQRAPDPLPIAAPERQRVGIMNLRTPIVCHAAVVLAALEHAGQRRNAESLNGLAWIEGGIHVHHRRC